MSESDFVRKAGDAYEMWQARSTWVSTQLEQLAGDRPTGESDGDRLDRLVSQVIAPATMSDLLELEADR